jgi:hypothetical protein
MDIEKDHKHLILVLFPHIFSSKKKKMVHSKLNFIPKVTFYIMLNHPFLSAHIALTKWPNIVILLATTNIKSRISIVGKLLYEPF